MSPAPQQTPLGTPQTAQAAGPQAQASSTPIAPAAPQTTDYAAARAQFGARTASVLDKYPPVIQSLAPQIASYSLKLPQGAALKFDPKTGIDWPMAIKAATEYAGTLPDGTPAFDQKQYESRQKFLDDWNSSKQGSTGARIGSAHKLINHLGDFSDAADQLNNSGGFLGLSYPWNVVADKYGQYNDSDNGALQKMKVAINNIASEKANFYKGGAGNVSDIQANKEEMDPYLAKAQQKAAIQEELHMMGGQLKPLREQYIKTMGKAPPQPLLGPDERTILQKFGVDPDAVEQGHFVPGQNLQSVTSQNPQGATPNSTRQSILERHGLH